MMSSTVIHSVYNIRHVNGNTLRFYSLNAGFEAIGSPRPNIRIFCEALIPLITMKSRICETPRASADFLFEILASKVSYVKSHDPYIWRRCHFYKAF